LPIFPLFAGFLPFERLWIAPVVARYGQFPSALRRRLLAMPTHVSSEQRATQFVVEAAAGVTGGMARGRARRRGDGACMLAAIERGEARSEHIAGPSAQAA